MVDENVEIPFDKLLDCFEALELADTVFLYSFSLSSSYPTSQKYMSTHFMGG